MTVRLFAVIAGLLASTAEGLWAAAQHIILLVIADEYGVDSRSLCNSNVAATLPPTPNINSLAPQAVLFRKAYAYPTCSPTRSCLSFGTYGRDTSRRRNSTG